MRATLIGVLIFVSTTSQALANDWSIMADWRKTEQQAQSAFFNAGHGYSDLPPRISTAMRLAMFSAANAVEQDYSQYLEDVKAPKGADSTLAAIAAASQVLVMGYGDAVKHVVLDHQEKYFEGADPDVAKASLALGKSAAKAALARAQETVDDKYPPYKPQTSAGVYVTPYMPAFPSSFLDMKPWFLSSREAVRAPAPPALDSATWARDFNEVRRLGGKHNSERSAQQSSEALFWVGQGNEILIDQAAERRDWSLLQAARLHAMLAMAVDDSTLAVVESKYFWNFWRPITAIRRADLDGNDATEVDADWEPFRRTPNHPEYPCAHCQRGGTTAGVLEGEIDLMDGETFKVYDSKSPEKAITINSFKEFEERMSMSRIYIGAHYRSSNEAGEQLGRAVAQIAREHFAVPLRN